jgi:hypothetical protein
MSSCSSTRHAVRSAFVITLTLVALLAACTSPQPAPETPPAPPPPQPALQLGVLSSAARDTDKGPGQHNYTELYERLFLQWKNEPITIFEIGIANGGSLKMWQEYFPQARIVAVDIDPKSQFDNARVTTFIADQANRDQLKPAITAAGAPEILIDDGGHTMEQQQVSLGFLFRHVKPGGYYVIEDVHTSLPTLWKGYGVERDGANSTLGMIENYVRGARPSIKSKYMLAEEIAYLNQHIDTVTVSHRPQSRSIVVVLKKKKS